MSAQTAIDSLRAKKGVPNSINPDVHADTLQEIVDSVDAGTNFRDKLAALVGAARLPASAIKDLAAGGIPEAPTDGKSYGRKDGDWEQVSAQHSEGNVTPNGRWVNLVEFPQILFGETDTAVADISLVLKSTTSDFELYSEVHAVVLQGTDKAGTIQIESRISNYSGFATAQYRIVRESNSVYAPVRLQFFSSINEDLTGIVVNNLTENHPTDVTFGSLSIHTPVVGEQDLALLDVTYWQDTSTTSGTTGGIECDQIGKPAAEGSNLQFHKDRIIHQVGDSKTLEAFKHGLLVSGSANAVEQSPTHRYLTNDTPNIVVPDTEFGDLGMQVLQSTTFSPDLHSAFSGTTLPGFSLATNVTDYMYFQIPRLALVVPDVTATLTLGLTTRPAAAGSAGIIELLDRNGKRISTTTISQPTAKGEYTLYTFDFPSDGYIRINRAISGAGFVGVVSASWTLNQSPKIKQDHLVLDLVSNTRAFGLPKTLDFSGKAFEEGNMRASPLTSKPQAFTADTWADLVVRKEGILYSQFTRGYYPDEGEGTLDTQGWEINDSANVGRITLVDNQYGYDRLLRIIDNTSASPVGIQAGLDTAFMTNMGVNGFRWDFGMRVDAGATANYIQVTTDFQGTAGRWLMNAERNGADLDITVEGGGGATVTLPADTFHSFSVVVEAGESDGKLLVDGVVVLDIPFSAQTVTEGLALHTSGSSPSVDEDFWMRDTTLTSLETLEKTLTRSDLDASTRQVVPTVGNPLTMKLPKGSFKVGTNFTVVNGSTKETTLASQDGDSHLFGGKKEYKVQPSALVTLTQEASPRGTSWAVSGGLQKTIHTTGHSLHMHFDETGAILNRHGTYTGDVNVVRTIAGQYSIRIAGGHVYSENDTTIIPVAIHGLVPRVAVGIFNVGQPEVRTFDLAGNQVDNQVSISIYW